MHLVVHDIPKRVFGKGYQFVRERSVVHKLIGNYCEVCSGLVACVLIKSGCDYRTPSTISRWCLRVGELSSVCFALTAGCRLFGDTWTTLLSETINGILICSEYFF